MASVVRTSLIDDLDGGPAVTTVTFALDGRVHQIDLSLENTQKLRDLMNDYVAAGRRVHSNRRIGTPNRVTPSNRGVRTPAPAPVAAPVPLVRPPAPVAEVPAQRSATALRRDRTDQVQAIRAWARVSGWPDIANRGRVPREIVQAFAEAHGGVA